MSLDLLSFFLGNAFLNRLGATLNHVLSFLQTQTGDLTDNLDNAQLLVAETSQDYVELGLLFNSGSSSSSACTSNSNGSSSRYAELLFNSLYKLIELKDRKRLNLFNNSKNLLVCHFNIPPEM